MSLELGKRKTTGKSVSRSYIWISSNTSHNGDILESPEGGRGKNGRVPDTENKNNQEVAPLQCICCRICQRSRPSQTKSYMRGAAWRNDPVHPRYIGSDGPCSSLWKCQLHAWYPAELPTRPLSLYPVLFCCPGRVLRQREASLWLLDNE